MFEFYVIGYLILFMVLIFSLIGEGDDECSIEIFGCFVTTLFLALSSWFLLFWFFLVFISKKPKH